MQDTSKAILNTVDTTEIIDRINEIEAAQGKHLPVRCEAPTQVIYTDDDEYLNSDDDEAVFRVIDVKYRSGSANRLPYIALICR